ncbi:MAG TPA: hypothetical protein VIH59_27685 [Candidatus Tectomicrobia bacterium]|jgi:hypothetical protein
MILTTHGGRRVPNSSQTVEMQHLVETFQHSQGATAAPHIPPPGAGQPPVWAARALAGLRTPRGHGQTVPVMREDLIPFDEDHATVRRDF